jgi:hypothetical protein
MDTSPDGGLTCYASLDRKLGACLCFECPASEHDFSSKSDALVVGCQNVDVSIRFWFFTHTHFSPTRRPTTARRQHQAPPFTSGVVHRPPAKVNKAQFFPIIPSRRFRWGRARDNLSPKRSRAPPCQPRRHQMASIHEAARTGNLEQLKQLVEGGASPSAHHGDMHLTPLIEGRQVRGHSVFDRRVHGRYRAA